MRQKRPVPLVLKKRNLIRNSLENISRLCYDKTKIGDKNAKNKIKR